MEATVWHLHVPVLLIVPGKEWTDEKGVNTLSTWEILTRKLFFSPCIPHPQGLRNNCFAFFLFYYWSIERKTDAHYLYTFYRTQLGMCLRNRDAPLAATKSKYSKNLQVLHFNQSLPQGHEMWVKCEQSIDELTIKFWLLCHHPNFKYCTLLVSGTELQTDGRMDG